MTIESDALRRCLRSASERTPLIKHCVVKALHGPDRGKRHQLASAIQHAQFMLDELKSQQLVLGWRDDDERASA